MRLWRRRRTGIRVVVLIDGREHPAWALRAGSLITATDYDHGKREMVVQVERQTGTRPLNANGPRCASEGRSG